MATLMVRQDQVLETFKAEGFPTTRHENWLYWAPDKALQEALLSPVKTAKQEVLADTENLVIKNGRLQSAPQRPGCQVYINTLPDSLQKPLKYTVASSPISLLNQAQYPESITVHLTQSQSKPLRLTVTEEAGAGCSAVTRVVVVVDSGVQAQVSVEHCFEGHADAVSNTTFELCCLDHARCDVSHLIQPSKSTQFLHSVIHMSKSSEATYITALTENARSRFDTEAHFYEEDATLELKGLAVLEGEQQNYTHIKANHYAKNCTCSQVYKTVLTDRSLAEFSGLVSVKKGAHGVDSQQLNQTLLLSDAARALSRPQLKIDADDVQCAHGATVGQLHPNELFYIQSRGLSEAEARLLLIFGFTETVLLAIVDPEMKEALTRHLKERVSRLNQAPC